METRRREKYRDKKKKLKRTSCNKRKYKSKNDVKDILSQMRKRGREEIRFYWCRDCSAYHLTSRKRILIWDEDDE